MFKWFRKDPNQWPENMLGRRYMLYKVISNQVKGKGVVAEVDYFTVDQLEDALDLLCSHTANGVAEGYTTAASLRWIDFERKQEQVVRRHILNEEEGLRINVIPMDVSTAPLYASLESYELIRKEMKDGI